MVIDYRDVFLKLLKMGKNDLIEDDKLFHLFCGIANWWDNDSRKKENDFELCLVLHLEVVMNG